MSYCKQKTYLNLSLLAISSRRQPDPTFSRTKRITTPDRDQMSISRPAASHDPSATYFRQLGKLTPLAWHTAQTTFCVMVLFISASNNLASMGASGGSDSSSNARGARFGGSGRGIFPSSCSLPLSVTRSELEGDTTSGSRVFDAGVAAGVCGRGCL